MIHQDDLQICCKAALAGFVIGFIFNWMLRYKIKEYRELKKNKIT